MIPRKPSYKGLTRRPMRRGVGKSSRAKQQAEWRRELLAEWELKGIDRCEFRFEGCMPTFGLALAHSKKRRFILNREDYFAVGLACILCHDKLDMKMSHEEMEAAVTAIIESR